MISRTFFEIISPWIDRRYYAFTTFATILAITILCQSFTRDKIKDETDLISIKSKLFQYSFTHGRKGSAMYYIWLEGYGCTFQIPANYIRYFNKALFEIEITRGNEIEILIPKIKADELEMKTEILVFQIRKGNSIYLNKKDPLRYEKGNQDDILFGVGSLLAGLIYYFIRRFIWKPSFL